MGGPELPQDPGEEDVRSTTLHHQHIMPPPSDDSDNENTVNAYDGYEPLPMDEGGEVNNPNGNGDNVDNTNTQPEDIDLMQAEVTHGDPNLPHIESADSEIERQIWNEPRPRELQLELDNTRTEQILNAMAGFSLPNVAVPAWAAGVPEERWKNELLQRIRQRDKTEGAADKSEPPTTDKHQTSK